MVTGWSNCRSPTRWHDSGSYWTEPARPYGAAVPTPNAHSASLGGVTEHPTTRAEAFRVRSADGTTIAGERSGAGPALVFVDAAGGYSGFGSLRSLAEMLAADFTVYTYDRRGRGGSGDTLPYAIEREIDDLGAVVAEAGGSAYGYAFSSGGLLALHAAANGLPLTRLALLEPPIGDSETPTGETDFTRELASLVAAGRQHEAAEFFQRSIGVPPEVIAEMETMPTLAAVAHTLVYDCIISDAASVGLLRTVRVPTLVLDSQGSSDDLTGWAAAVAAALPAGTHRSLPGEWHGVADDVLGPVLTEFFQSDRTG
ncbi:MAG: alpha/beta fold hydrolase [Micromonosporaceae bacterium]|nr:alpha/beta fold hydrolase [Micromonosporaceae bacterium]